MRAVAASPSDVEAHVLVVTLFQLADGEKRDAEANAWSSGLVAEFLVGGGKRDAYSPAVARNAASVAIRQPKPENLCRRDVSARRCVHKLPSIAAEDPKNKRRRPATLATGLP